MNLTPAQVAVLDQATAQEGRKLDALVETLRRLSAKRGRTQATCDVGALLLTDRFEAMELAVLLGIAIDRLAEREPTS